MQQRDPFADYLTRWRLVPDGAPIVTPRAQLLPVRRNGEPAMLKVSTEPEEMFGARLMSWWNGEGAARVLACENWGLLLERATTGRALSDLVRGGQDDEASRITCRVIAQLHAPRREPPPDLVPLAHWFRDLTEAPQEGLLARAKALALVLLSEPHQPTVLHGDIHHDNILDFGERGWLVIDPKRLIGDRYFDYTNLFCNPDLASATNPEQFAHRLAIVSEAAGLDRTRLLQWLLAWCGLSAVWCLNDPQSIDVTDKDRLDIDLKVAELAATELDR
ncbi:aminoglycoside phosphotransferase family protein [Bradyrhizobium sp. LHD-71]|uniref:aminoglycoside phosphotransferase family protein n=1 Tax=Bradyrhizobium sp. LHD-71 TaxID=3072141 RepID=UPI00280F32D1|nr:aminoglycoside phosphotransferase family protein [Bradyrhizobium sp. LHD-71]MDQ8731800.1 aminoglycoside phosphotransferase family protein [Bradyrhizobium sp. LHD-71]